MPVNVDRIIAEGDRMVASGRITQEEAGRLRAAEGSAAFEEVVACIRARHAQAHTDAAVSGGAMSEEEADALLQQVRDGEPSAELRRHIKGPT